MNSSRRKWVSVKDASEYLSLNPKTLYSLAARGLLPPGAVLKLGRSIRINLSAIEEAAGSISRRDRGADIMSPFSESRGVKNGC